MLIDITMVRLLDGYQLHLTFEDGIQGIVDIAQLIEFAGVFEPLTDLVYFSQVAVNPDLGTIYWPSGADLDPDVLYSLVTGQPLPQLVARSQVPG